MPADPISRLAQIRCRIGDAARLAGRPPGAVRLVAVSKTFPASVVRQVVEVGQIDLGENRVQEAEAKIEVLGPGVEWHLLGHLQRNKARRAAALFHWVHGVDSEPLARRLEQGATAAGRVLRVLVQVDLVGEPQKSGVRPAALHALLASIREMPSLALRGLMVLPPLQSDAEASRPYFRQLRRLGDEAAAAGLLPAQPELSMGMSADFEVAIEEGATLVRVGTALFGGRSPGGRD